MRLNLTKPLVIFDLETTGLDIAKDRIVQISYIKVRPGDKDGDEERKSIFVNPEMPIPLVVQKLTSITDDMVKDAPTFKQLAKTLAATFTGCDFAGYNSNHFDVPMLAEEMLRAGVDFDFSRCRLIDAQTIYFHREPRNLSAAYRFFTGRKMEDDFQAHRADQDTEATYRVLQGELDKYEASNVEDPKQALANDMDALAQESKQNDNVDFAGRMIWQQVKDADGNPVLGEDGKPVRAEYFNFGKYRGRSVVEVLRSDPGYYGWMLNSDFTLNTKQILTRIKLREAKMNL